MDAFPDPGRYLIGLDPGRRGALAWVGFDEKLIKTWRLPRKFDRHGLQAIIDEIGKARGRPDCIVIEHQQTFGVQATFANSDTRLMLYGQILGALKVCNWRVVAVRPQTWQAHYKLAAGMPKASRDAPREERTRIREERHRLLKQRAIRMARSIFSGREEWSDAEADAALIGLYGIHVLKAVAAQSRAG